MLAQYMPILILLVLGALMGGVIVTMSLITPRLLEGNPTPSVDKGKTYECGVEPLGTARERFDVKFYLVAMLFILFDLEVVFLYPWAIVYRQLVVSGWWILWSMAAFVVVLLVGLAYAWRSGALEWNR